jgi:predicted ester cyclase
MRDLMKIHDIAKMHLDGINFRTIESSAKDYVAPNYIGIDGPTRREAHGIAGYIQSYQRWFMAFPDGRFEVLNQEIVGNKVTTALRGTGTFTGQLQTLLAVIPGNGRELNLEAREQLEIQNNKIVHSRLDYDIRDMSRQLSLEALLV